MNKLSKYSERLICCIIIDLILNDMINYYQGGISYFDNVQNKEKMFNIPYIISISLSIFTAVLLESDLPICIQQCFKNFLLVNAFFLNFKSLRWRCYVVSFAEAFEYDRCSEAKFLPRIHCPRQYMPNFVAYILSTQPLIQYPQRYFLQDK